jgi:hypothetical protein
LINDPDIVLAAKLFIDRYGEHAPLRAARHADDLIRQGDYCGGVVWRLIAEAMEELTCSRWQGGRLIDERDRTRRNAAKMLDG